MMRAARRGCVRAGLVFATALLVAQTARAEDLKISTTPPGASLEIDGMPVGKTPYKVKYPGGYFHKPHTAFGTRLEHAMVARFTMAGYVTQEVTLTDGPLAWVAVNGKREGNYFVLKSDHFNIELEPRVKVADASFDPAQSAGPLPYHAPERGADRAPARPAGEVNSPDAAHAGTVSITCDSAAAEIYVDGKFVGQAPATLHLASGSHRVEIKALGKRSWTRDLEVMRDSQISLHPALEPSP